MHQNTDLLHRASGCAVRTFGGAGGALKRSKTVSEPRFIKEELHGRANKVCDLLRKMTRFYLVWTSNRYSFDTISAMYQPNLNLLAQNDRLVLSFRLRGRSTSSSFRKSLSDQKGARGASVQMPPPNFARLWSSSLNNTLACRQI